MQQFVLIREKTASRNVHGRDNTIIYYRHVRETSMELLETVMIGRLGDAKKLGIFPLKVTYS